MVEHTIDYLANESNQYALIVRFQLALPIVDMIRQFLCASSAPNAQPIAFQQVVPEYFETFIRFFLSQKVAGTFADAWGLRVCNSFSKHCLELEVRVGIEQEKEVFQKLHYSAINHPTTRGEQPHN